MMLLALLAILAPLALGQNLTGLPVTQSRDSSREGDPDGAFPTGFFRIRAYFGHENCLTLEKDANKIVKSRCNNDDIYQFWRYDSNTKAIKASNEHCLTLASSPKTLTTSQCSNEPNQAWYFDDKGPNIGLVRSSYDDKALCMSLADDHARVQDVGATTCGSYKTHQILYLEEVARVFNLTIQNDTPWPLYGATAEVEYGCCRSSGGKVVDIQVQDKVQKVIRGIMSWKLVVIPCSEYYPLPCFRPLRTIGRAWTFLGLYHNKSKFRLFGNSNNGFHLSAEGEDIIYYNGRWQPAI